MSSRAAHDAPFWCEENAWHLCVDPRIGEGAHVIVISNRRRSVALWNQRAATQAGAPVVWDYHVIVVSADRRTWDLDTILAFPIGLDAYLAGTFRRGIPADLEPRFRIVSAATYRSEFASDRRHMRDGRGGWQQPLPSWPPIGSGHVLDALLDRDDPRFGHWHDAAALRAQLSLVP